MYDGADLAETAGSARHRRRRAGATSRRGGVARGLHRLRAGLRLPRERGLALRRPSPGFAAHPRAGRCGGTGRRLLGRLPARDPGRLAARSARPPRDCSIRMPRPRRCSRRERASASAKSPASTARDQVISRAQENPIRSFLPPSRSPDLVTSTGRARGIRIVEPGLLATLQDLGREGAASVGVAVSGALDRGALRTANRLLGNPEGAAAIEVTMGGLRAVAEDDLWVAVTGAWGARPHRRPRRRPVRGARVARGRRAAAGLVRPRRPRLRRRARRPRRPPGSRVAGDRSARGPRTGGAARRRRRRHPRRRGRADPGRASRGVGRAARRRARARSRPRTARRLVHRRRR